MAKKRKLNTKAAESTTPAQQKKQQKKKQDEEQQQQEEEALKQQQKDELEAQKDEQQEAQLIEEEGDEVEEEEEIEEEETEFVEEEEEVEEEDEEEVEDEDEEDEYEGAKEIGVGGDVKVPEDDDEPISKLLEPFTKDQLMMILREAAENHADVATRVRKVADEDTVHRKIFVHGLGWDTTADTLRSAFSQYGEIEDCKAVTDKVSGKSKGYGFILFKSRTGARKALESPQKRIGGRMTACQLAAVGPVPTSASTVAPPQQPASEYTMRKIYVSNVSADIDPNKLTAFFSKFGEIEEGPLGLDKQTGKPKGFCLFVYRSVESARKALEEPHKHFEGHVLHCQKAIDGPKPGKQQMGQQSRGGHYGGRVDNPNLAGAIGGGPATGAGLMGQSVGGAGFNQGAAAAAPTLNPVLGQALSALLASQGAGMGLNNLLGTLGTLGGAPGGAAGHGAYGGQSVGVNPTVLGYGNQGGLQSAYPNQQMGQGGGGGRSSHGHITPYGGH